MVSPQGSQKDTVPLTPYLGKFFPTSWKPKNFGFDCRWLNFAFQNQQKYFWTNITALTDQPWSTLLISFFSCYCPGMSLYSADKICVVDHSKIEWFSSFISYYKYFFHCLVFHNYQCCSTFYQVDFWASISFQYNYCLQMSIARVDIIGGMISVVNLTEFRISRELDLWACLCEWSWLG